MLSSKQNTGGKALTLIRGICFIDPTGIVHSKIYGGDEVRGYVNNDVYHNEHTFVISNFYSTGNSQFKYHYTLTTVTESADDNPQVLGLEGVYSGVYEAVPRAGKIMYCKIDDFNSWEDLDQAELDYKRADLSTSNLHIELRGNKYLDKWQTVYNSLLSDGHMITAPRKRSSNLDNIDGSRTIRKKQ